MRAAIAAALALAGCVKTNTVTCGDNICRAGEGCAPDGQTCAPTDALERCAGATDGASCTTQDLPEGVCVAQICVPVGCGNGVVEPGELCDDGNRLSLDGCRSDCKSLERCGDGVAELTLDETCDCGDTGTTPAGCNGPNSNAAGATCRMDCTTARCGDGIVDPDELCDDGNTRYGDGCRGDCRGQFAKVPAGTVQAFSGLSIAGPDDVWLAAGDSNTLVHLAGGTATVIDPELTITTQDMVLYVFARDGVAYIGGIQTLRRRVGTTWQTLTTSLGNPVSIVGTSASDVWVAGDGASTVTVSLWHFTSPTDLGTKTTTCNYGSVMPHVQTLLALGAGEVVVGSDRGVCRRTAGGWQAELTTSAIQALAGTADDLWALDTTGKLYHLDDATTGTWTSRPSAPGRFNALTAVSPGHLIGVGGSGGIAAFDDTHGWQVLASPSELTLFAVGATSPADVWIAGAGGTLLH